MEKGRLERATVSRSVVPAGVNVELARKASVESVSAARKMGIPWAPFMDSLLLNWRGLKAMPHPGKDPGTPPQLPLKRGKPASVAHNFDGFP